MPQLSSGFFQVSFGGPAQSELLSGASPQVLWFIFLKSLGQGLLLWSNPFLYSFLAELFIFFWAKNSGSVPHFLTALSFMFFYPCLFDCFNYSYQNEKYILKLDFSYLFLRKHVNSLVNQIFFLPSSKNKKCLFSFYMLI